MSTDGVTVDDIRKQLEVLGLKRINPNDEVEEEENREEGEETPTEDAD